MKRLLALAALPLAFSPVAAPLAASDKPAVLAPSEIVAAAPVSDWQTITSSDLLVMKLAPDSKGKPRQVVIQLMPPPFRHGWIGNIRKLAATHWWDGTAINRVQDNYVVQWGDPDAEDKAKAKALPTGLVTVPESGYEVPIVGELLAGLQRRILMQALQIDYPDQVKRDLTVNPGYATSHDAYGLSGFDHGWPIGMGQKSVWPIHCYGMVGVGRNLSPDTGTGAELYTVIGHAPRHLDRNIALIGRVIEGIEHLSSLPRGTGALGFYETPEERTAIRQVRLGSEVAGLPRYEYLSTETASFARYADARANRRDAFFIRPAGGADICNIPVPVRRVK